MRQVRGLQDGPAIPKPRRALPTAGRSRSRRRPVGKTASRSARTRQSPPASSRVSSRRYREKRRRGRVWQRGATDDPPLRERLWHRPVSGHQEWGLSRKRAPLGQGDVGPKAPERNSDDTERPDEIRQTSNKEKV